MLRIQSLAAIALLCLDGESFEAGKEINSRSERKKFFERTGIAIPRVEQQEVFNK